MQNNPVSDAHKTTPTEITSLFGQAKLILEETPKAITPFGGLASFITFLGQIGYAKQVQQCLPFAPPTSNNAIPLAHTLTAFIVSVVAGARRFAHCQWLRADRVLQALLGLDAFRAMTSSATSFCALARRRWRRSGGRSGGGSCAFWPAPKRGFTWT